MVSKCIWLPLVFSEENVSASVKPVILGLRCSQDFNQTSCFHSIKISLNSYLCAVEEPTTSPPVLSRPELWISLAFLLMIITVGVCVRVLFLRFQRGRCRLKNVDERDVTLLKVPKGDDPTYGVRAH